MRYTIKQWRGGCRLILECPDVSHAQAALRALNDEDTIIKDLPTEIGKQVDDVIKPIRPRPVVVPIEPTPVTVPENVTDLVIDKVIKGEDYDPMVIYVPDPLPVARDEIFPLVQPDPSVVSDIVSDIVTSAITPDVDDTQAIEDIDQPEPIPLAHEVPIRIEDPHPHSADMDVPIRDVQESVPVSDPSNESLPIREEYDTPVVSVPGQGIPTGVSLSQAVTAIQNSPIVKDVTDAITKVSPHEVLSSVMGVASSVDQMSKDLLRSLVNASVPVTHEVVKAVNSWVSSVVGDILSASTKTRTVVPDVVVGGSTVKVPVKIRNIKSLEGTIPKTSARKVGVRGVNNINPSLLDRMRAIHSNAVKLNMASVGLDAISLLLDLELEVGLDDALRAADYLNRVIQEYPDELAKTVRAIGTAVVNGKYSVVGETLLEFMPTHSVVQVADRLAKIVARETGTRDPHFEDNVKFEYGQAFEDPASYYQPGTRYPLIEGLQPFVNALVNSIVGVATNTPTPAERNRKVTLRIGNRDFELTQEVADTVIELLNDTDWVMKVIMGENVTDVPSDVVDYLHSLVREGEMVEEASYTQPYSVLYPNSDGSYTNIIVDGSMVDSHGSVIPEEQWGDWGVDPSRKEYRYNVEKEEYEDLDLVWYDDLLARGASVRSVRASPGADGFLHPTEETEKWIF